MNGVKLIEHARWRKSAPEQSRAALERLRAVTRRADARLRTTTVRDDVPLHPVSAQVIRHCLTLIEQCWTVRSDERSDDLIDRMRRVADIMRLQAETFRNGDADPGYAGERTDAPRLALVPGE